MVAEFSFFRIFHLAASKSISSHSMWRSSPGRTNTRGARCKAHLVTGDPWYPFMARSNPATFLGSVIAERCFGLTGGKAPRRSAAESLSALPVAMAYRNTRLQIDLTLCADSSAPRDSIRRRTINNSFAFTMFIGCAPIYGNIFVSRRLIVVAAYPGVHVEVNFVCRLPRHHLKCIFILGFCGFHCFTGLAWINSFGNLPPSRVTPFPRCGQTHVG